MQKELKKPGTPCNLIAMRPRPELQKALLLELLDRGGRAAPSDISNGLSVYESLAVRFKLTKEELAETTCDGENRNKWDNTVRWTRDDLVAMGLLHREPHGLWRLTDLGEQPGRRIERGVEEYPLISD